MEGVEGEGKLEPLTEKQQNEVPTAVEVFGMDWVCYDLLEPLYSGWDMTKCRDNYAVSDRALDQI